MTDDDLRRLHERGRRAAGASPIEVPLDRLAALAEGRLPHEEALALADVVMADPGLAGEFALLQAAHASGRGLRAAPAWRRPLVLAAAAVFVASATVAVRAGLRDADPAVRGGPGGAVSLVAPAPGAVVALPATLTWRAVPGALAYRVEVLDGDGTPVFALETRDTMAPLRSGALQPGVRHTWFVEATVPGATLRSALQPIEVRRID